jgi:O-antigen ligase
MASKQKHTTNSSLLLVGWVVVGLFFSGFIFDTAAREPFLPLRQLFVSLWLVVGAILVFRMPDLKIAFPLATRFFLLLSLAFLGWNFSSISWSLNPTEAILASNRVLLQVSLCVFFIITAPLLLERLGLLSRILAGYLCFLGVLSVLQYAGWTNFPIESSSPPAGLSGNRNLLGSTLVILLPWALYLFFSGQRYSKIAGLISIGAGVIALLLSQTRSAWVASLFAFATIQVLLLLRRSTLSPELKARWKLVNLSVAGAVIIMLGFLTMSGQGNQLRDNLLNRFSTLVQVPGVNEQAANEAERNILDRFHLWQHTIELIKDHPVKGGGAGNWKIRFPEYGGSSAPRFEEKDKLRVRPHNEYLSIASELGLVGFALFILLLVTLAYQTLQLLFKARTEQDVMLRIVLIGIGTGLVVDFVFSFPLERMSHSYLIALNIGLALLPPGSSTDRKTRPGVWAVLPGLAALAALAISYYNWQANRSFHQLLRAEVSGQWDKAVSISLETEQMPLTSLDPLGDPVEWHSANALKQVGKSGAALEKIEKAIKAHPNSHRIWNTKAAILIQQEQFQEAIEPLKRALTLAPDYEPALSNLGYALYRTDQFEAAVTTLLKLDLEKYTKVLPVIWDAGQRMERSWLNNSPFYQAGLNALKPPASLPMQQWPAKMRQLRGQFESDEAFVVQYFQTLGHYEMLKAWSEKQPPKTVMSFNAALQDLYLNLAQQQDYTALADQVIQNHHIETLRKIRQLTNDETITLNAVLTPLPI